MAGEWANAFKRFIGKHRPRCDPVTVNYDDHYGRKQSLVSVVGPLLVIPSA